MLEFSFYLFSNFILYSCLSCFIIFNNIISIFTNEESFFSLDLQLLFPFFFIVTRKSCWYFRRNIFSLFLYLFIFFLFGEKQTLRSWLIRQSIFFLAFIILFYIMIDLIFLLTQLFILILLLLILFLNNCIFFDCHNIRYPQHFILLIFQFLFYWFQFQ